jgi:hypothetical protein
MNGRRTEIRILLPQSCVRLIDLGNSFVYVHYAFKVPGRSWRSTDGRTFREGLPTANRRGSA